MYGTTPKSTSAHDDAVLRFVERFALLLNEAGLPRMSARVFAYVLADDAESYSARELAEGLRVSPAAISGAVRMLVQAGMLAKERDPGSRVDHYRVYDDDVWSAIMLQRRPVLDRYEEVMAEGVAQLGRDRRGGRRVEETLEFYRFMNEDLLLLIERWREHRRRWLEQQDDAATEPGQD
ncbi:MarR family transcriptional regulator [Phytoactinopolyspora alkaliphila]|uniref:MarR family transcriptional regulator n=2 Tax=Phytoactinopolyspora alkaliphila TaxID=1783498 RepID=A0A6N9YLI7_9ACTN|nr:MarR family transcriptional regulator [Phytoactinopolyspora alkaliphila]